MRKFYRLKLLFQKLRPLFNIRLLGAIVVIILGYFFFTSSIFFVSDVTVVQINNKKFIKESEIFACTKQFIGKNIFSVNNDEVEKAVENCTVLTRNIRVNKILPSEIQISIDEIEPEIKFTFKDNCYLVDNKVLVKKLELDKCDRYTVPEVKGVTQSDNLFVFGVIVRIIQYSESINIESPTEYEQILEGQTIFIRASYNDHTVLFSPNISPDLYVTQYINTLEGLKGRNESFREIDFRFDRVIVR